MEQVGCYINWPWVFLGFKTILDPLAVASWPIAIGFVFWFLRQPITALIQRIKKVDGFGAQAEFSPIEQRAEHKPSGSAELFLQKNRVATALPPQHDVYDMLDQSARKILQEAVQGDSDLQLQWAIRMRSISEAERIHEANYRIMFGSQLKALKELHLLLQAPASHFFRFYQEAASNPDWKLVYETRTFEEWGRFLINIGYVEVVSGTDPEEVRITPLGSHFLIWMTERRIPDFRPF